MMIRSFLLLGVACFFTAHAQTYSVLKHFSGADGHGPVGPLVVSGTTLYGTTYRGGNSGYGTVFQARLDGTGHSVLKHFGGPSDTSGSTPTGHLILSGSTLFGAVEAGTAGNGGVFKISTNGSGFSVLYGFNSADLYNARPRAGLALIGETLFGTTYGKATPSGYGTVFRLTKTGSSFATMIRFDPYLFPGDGKNPYTCLTASGTSLFGTTYAGGALDKGTIFRLSTNAAFSYLKGFSGSDGANPRTPLLVSGGTLFGATMNGGSSGVGTLFRLYTNGTGYTVLKHFTGSEGSYPLGSLLLAGNFLYGTTYAGGSSDMGVLFRIHTNGTRFAVMKEFNGADGANPGGGLVRSQSTLYGTAYGGGESSMGILFRLSLSPELSVERGGNSVEVSWPSSSGLDYQVQVRTNPSQAGWVDLGSPITASGDKVTVTEPIQPDLNLFYRVVLLE